MALFSECMQQCAKKVVDNADIVRDGRVVEGSPLSRQRRAEVDAQHHQQNSYHRNSENGRQEQTGQFHRRLAFLAKLEPLLSVTPRGTRGEISYLLSS